MLDHLDASSDALRLAVAKAFHDYKTRDLISLLEDKDAIVRTTAARELQIRSGEDVFAAILGLAQHKRFELREIAAFVLGQLGTPICPFARESYPLLLELLKDDYHEVVAAALLALGALKSLGHADDERIASAIAEQADSADEDVREAVAYSLGFWNCGSTETVISRLLDDDSAIVRAASEFSLELRAARAGLEGGGDAIP